MRTGIRAVLVLLGIGLNMALAAEGRPLLPIVEVEEGVYTYEPADNGAGPLWCYGATCLVRVGDEVFASGEATGERGPRMLAQGVVVELELATLKEERVTDVVIPTRVQDAFGAIGLDEDFEGRRPSARAERR